MLKNNNEDSNELISHEENIIAERIKNLTSSPKKMKNDEDYYLDENNSELKHKNSNEKEYIAMSIEDHIKNLSDRINEIELGDLTVPDTIIEFSGKLDNEYIKPLEIKRAESYYKESNRYLNSLYSEFSAKKDSIYKLLEEIVRDRNDNNADKELENLKYVLDIIYSHNDIFVTKDHVLTDWVRINNHINRIQSVFDGERIPDYLDQEILLVFAPSFAAYLDESAILFQKNDKSKSDLSEILARISHLKEIKKEFDGAIRILDNIKSELDEVEDSYRRNLESARDIFFDSLSEIYHEISYDLSEYKENFTFETTERRLPRTEVRVDEVKIYDNLDELVNQIYHFNEAKINELTLYRDLLERSLEAKNKLQGEQDSVNYQSDEQDSINYQRKEQDTENYQIDEQDSVNYQKGEDI